MTQRLNALNDAEAVVTTAELGRTHPDFVAPVVIYEVLGAQRQPLFTGIVDTVERTDLGVHIAFHNDPALEEEQIRSWAIRDVSAQEMFWSTVRMAGYEEEQVGIEGWVPGPWEVFEVVAPLRGITWSGGVVGGSVRIGREQALPALAAEFDGADIAKEFSAADAWAVATVTARTLWEAEQDALTRLDHALDWLMLRLNYSFDALPGGGPRSWRRHWAEAVPRRMDVVLVRGIRSGRRWLRAPRTIRTEVTIDLSDVSDVLRPDLPVRLTRQEELAITSWRRARETSDPTLALGALFEALEFYAFDVRLPRLFSPDEEDAIRERAVAGLDDAARQRVKSKLYGLNQPPLFEQLGHAIRTDAVPIHSSELEMLRRLRQKRNDSVHGRGGAQPDAIAVRYAIAVLARLLVYRVHRRSIERLLLQVNSGDPDTEADSR